MDPGVWELLPENYGCLQQVELVECPLYITEHRFSRFRNRVTGRIYTTPRPNDLKGQGLFGPRMLALTTCLKSGLHGSYSAIQTLYRDAFNLPVSLGYLVKATDQMTKSLAMPYDALKQTVRRQSVVNIDETGHKENGKRLMTWVATCAQATVFRIADSRSTAELYALLGEDFEGVIGSDFFSAYLKYKRENDGVQSQYCWAHLIRELSVFRRFDGQNDSNLGCEGAGAGQETVPGMASRSVCGVPRGSGADREAVPAPAQACRDQDAGRADVEAPPRVLPVLGRSRIGD